MAEGTLKRQPFHETIVQALNGATPSWDVALSLSWLITSTKIPANHSSIITAWANYMDRVENSAEQSSVRRAFALEMHGELKVVESLERQKGEAEAVLAQELDRGVP